MTPNDAMLMQTLVESGILSSEDFTLLSQGPESDALGVASEPTDLSASAVLQKLEELGRLSAFQVQALEQGGPTSLVLGDYILLDRLGVGGMGEVFRAMHRVMRREVAIKRLKTNSVNVAGLAERFMREVRTAAKLSHPNIVTAYDAGEDATGCYLVMEYVQGRDLSELISDEGPMRLDRAVDYLLQAAQAIAYAHHAGIIHRDIKPANFLIDLSGTLKLLDLGLARVEQTIAEAEHSQNLTLTHANQIVGTLAFMAPEQAEDPHAASVAADLYALGCTFCNLLIARPPFQAKSIAQAIIAHRQLPPPDLSSLLPPALDALYQSLLAKDPSQRPGSADEVVQTLQGIMAGGALSQWLASHDEAPTLASIDAIQPAIVSTPVPATIDTAVIPVASSTKHKDSKRPWLIAGGVVALVSVLVAIAFGLGFGAISSPPTTENTQSEPPAESPADESARTPPLPVPPSSATLPQILNTTAGAQFLQTEQARLNDTAIAFTNSIGMDFAYIPAGSCRVGSTDEHIAWAMQQATAEGLYDRYGPYINEESPQVVARMRAPFYMATTEVTVGQFRAFVQATGYKTVGEREGTAYNFISGYQEPDASWDNPGMEQDDSHPAINLTQPDCIAFCDWLSEEEGRTYRLPTAHQWEYACRAGSLGRWCYGDDPSAFYAYGWCYNNSPNSTQPVAQLRANTFGLYDMHGNAREWVLLNNGEPTDASGVGVVRGGSFTKPPVLLRSASQVGFRASAPYPYHGFRVLLEITPDSQAQ